MLQLWTVNPYPTLGSWDSSHPSCHSPERVGMEMVIGGDQDGNTLLSAWATIRWVGLSHACAESDLSIHLSIDICVGTVAAHAVSF